MEKLIAVVIPLWYKPEPPPLDYLVDPLLLESLDYFLALRALLLFINLSLSEFLIELYLLLSTAALDFILLPIIDVGTL